MLIFARQLQKSSIGNYYLGIRIETSTRTNIITSKIWGYPEIRIKPGKQRKNPNIQKHPRLTIEKKNRELWYNFTLSAGNIFTLRFKSDNASTKK